MRKLRIAVLVSGGGTNLQAIIDRVEDGTLPVEIVCVISNRLQAGALERAARHGIDHAAFSIRDYPEQRDQDAAIVAYLQEKHVDLVVLAGYLRIISRVFFETYAGRIINIHPALLPDFGGDGFYGLRVHEAVLKSGAKTTGATVHYVVPETDAGAVILQKSVEILPGDTPELLQKRVLTQAEHIILPEAIAILAKEWKF
ncbi:phosphoribosylglycinamide formyltransferase [Clostridia bacterium]|nr:phosphoribosylglycinamide formyltransferase [Clostridia bacterium]